jgi:hypothetical protein
MKKILVNFKIKKRVVKIEQKNFLQWYDILKQEMQIFTGGKLKFEYCEDPYLLKMGDDEKKQKGINSNYRMIPKAEKIEIIKKESFSDGKDLNVFFKNYLNYNDSRISIESSGDDFIIYSSPNDEVEDFIYQLERSGFKYKVI